MTNYNGITKNDLITLVLARGLAKNKTAARDMPANTLRALLVAHDESSVATEARDEDVLAEPHYVAPGAAEAHKSPAGFNDSLPENAGAHASPVLAPSAPKQRVRLTNEQRANKLTRNRRRHKRHLMSARHGWANGQMTPREAVRAALIEAES